MSLLNHIMSTPKTPRQNRQIPREQKDTSEPWIPESRIPKPRSPRSKLNSKLHNPPPQLSSSTPSLRSPPSLRSYSSAPSSPIPTAPTTPPSNLTFKMRNLWNTSHSKSFLSNLNIGLATNFPLKNLNLHSKKNVPVAYADEDALFGRDEYDDYSNHTNHTNHTNYSDNSKHSPTAMPIPKLSSPNGKPAKFSASYGGNNRVATNVDANPLSGPSTQHAEYLLSRVQGQFMGPDTPPLESPFGEVMDEGMDGFLSSRDGGLSFGFGSGRYDDDEGAGDRDQEDLESRTGKRRGKMVQKKQTLKTWKSIHQSCKEMLDSMHLSKCDGEITKATGQEDGNRFVDAGGYMSMAMAVDIEDEEENEDEAENNNEEKYDEKDVFTDAHSSSSGAKYWEQNQPRHLLIRTESQDSMVEIYTSPAISTSPSSSASSLKKHEQEQAQEKRETEIEYELNESLLTPRKPLRESDFAYMHMRPRLKTQSASEIDNTNDDTLHTLYENGNGNANKYRYCYPNNENNDQDNEDARSSLDMEDSLYDDVEKPILRMTRAGAQYPDFATMMDTSTYTDPYKDTQSQAALSGSHQRLEFDADAALEAPLSSLARLQFEYQLRCSEGSRER
ncbi:hypothetical protein BOTCAL_0055g00360 [Botryotinia calthae]|uniref:Uncharacterized protein n=1 Tax=Botryotinia calthae TaxID=38488 RepID=A0A4Y8DD15_9HELO|nr:hypothetical protein BOTCAL_0055g00360 [Botryotinia calthae]